MTQKPSVKTLKVIIRKKIPSFVPFLESEKAVAEKTKASVLKYNPNVEVKMVEGKTPEDVPQTKRVSWVLFNLVIPAYRKRGYNKGFYWIENSVKIKKSFELGGLLMTSVGQEKIFGSFNEKLKKGLVFYDYIPSMDPLKIYKSRLTHKGRDKEGLHLFDLNLNKTHFKLKVDKKGRPIFSSSKLGKFLIENRRIFSHSEKI